MSPLGRQIVKNLFVTGAEGFTGRRLVPYLQERGYEVVGGVRNRARKLAFEKQFGKAIVCDVGDAINVARAIASVKPDGVIHLASISAPQDCEADPLAAYQSIVTGWANVLDAVRRVCPRARVLMTSSCDVYGDTGNNEFNENAPLAPVGTFGSLKATAESIAQTFYQNNHLDVAVVRPFCFTGAGQPESQLLGALTRSILNADNVASVSGLDARRDVLHIDDLATAFHHLLEEGKPNQAYNVCSGRSYTIREIAQQIAVAAGKGSFRFEERNTDGATTPSYCGSNQRLCEEAGWQPMKNMQDAINDLVRSYQSQKAATPV